MTSPYYHFPQVNIDMLSSGVYTCMINKRTVMLPAFSMTKLINHIETFTMYVCMLTVIIRNLCLQEVLF